MTRNSDQHYLIPLWKNIPATTKAICFSKSIPFRFYIISFTLDYLLSSHSMEPFVADPKVATTAEVLATGTPLYSFYSVDSTQLPRSTYHPMACVRGPFKAKQAVGFIGNNTSGSAYNFAAVFTIVPAELLDLEEEVTV